MPCFTPLVLLLLLEEEDVVDGDVHLGDSQTNQALNPPYDVPAPGAAMFMDRVDTGGLC